MNIQMTLGKCTYDHPLDIHDITDLDKAQHRCSDHTLVQGTCHHCLNIHQNSQELLTHEQDLDARRADLRKLKTTISDLEIEVYIHIKKSQKDPSLSIIPRLLREYERQGVELSDRLEKAREDKLLQEQALESLEISLVDLRQRVKKKFSQGMKQSKGESSASCSP